MFHILDRLNNCHCCSCFHHYYNIEHLTFQSQQMSPFLQYHLSRCSIYQQYISGSLHQQLGCNNQQHNLSYSRSVHRGLSPLMCSPLHTRSHNCLDYSCCPRLLCVGLCTSFLLGSYNWSHCWMQSVFQQSRLLYSRFFDRDCLQRCHSLRS